MKLLVPSEQFQCFLYFNFIYFYIIRAIQNEKERRRELLNILESCARMRLEEDKYNFT